MAGEFSSRVSQNFDIDLLAIAQVNQSLGAPLIGDQPRTTMAVPRSVARRKPSNSAFQKKARQASPSSVLRNHAESDSDNYTVISDTASEAPEPEGEAGEERGELREPNTWRKNGRAGEEEDQRQTKNL